MAMADNEMSGLTQEEKEVLYKVMERAKEFDRATVGKVANKPLEGQLYKWTNPIKGWQPRWFYVDHDQGVLHYCTSEEKRKLPPRASLHLWGAVVSPSDEDAQSFTVQAANSDTYRLRAADARDRQSWVSRLRQEVEHANGLAAGPKEMIQSSAASTGNSLNSSSSNQTPLQSPVAGTNAMSPATGGTPTRKNTKKTQLSAPLHLSITKLGNKRRGGNKKGGGVGGGASFQEQVDAFPGGDAMLDSLTRLQSLQESLQQQLEKTEGTGLVPHDKNLLLLKSTSVAAVQSVQDCLAMMNVNLGRHSGGTSPAHHTLSQPILPSPTAVSSSNKKKSSRSKHRPVSMMDPRSMSNSSRQDDIDDMWGDDEDEGLSRSLSVSEVQSQRRNQQQHAGKVLSKEAP
ncbi:PREDICTED: oxysterol-binding protein-related protein 11-like isoform X2 [Amphimedon queenslandica]|uniref:PH domain-containing protein n=1 Tax=Amphimedon queenslandica TaxID=400682 RepID=A0A1X7U8B8_AMPQE|nr:PREDICTED: oxysterol-binding protein-related protein 11-like isoform X2 [Amphimedon queenslandica]|eukprot:XP_003388725.1 PREDICTED: oxysterol-binding protein-related protein 11-like isoform X2 [Amphimedon queenslandica]